MSYERLASRLYNVPLLLVPEKAEVIERVFRAHVDGTASALPKYEVTPRPDILEQAGMMFARQRGGYLRSDSGIALIQVVGTLVQRGGGMDAMSGLESYDNIGAQLQAALSDYAVLGILMEFDSPGGEGNGVAGLAEAIRAADAQKPVVAHANELAFSAAYWLAAAAGEIFVPKTGMVGSIGVIMLHVDQSRANEKRGLDVTHIQAGARKSDFSPHKPLSDTALNSAQTMVDRLYGQFVDHVAQSRGIDAQVVRDTEAGLLDPDRALALELVDGIGTLDQALQRLVTLTREPAKRKNYGRAAAHALSTGQLKETSMSDAPKGAAPAAAITPEQLAAARAEGVAEGKAAAKTEAEAEAKTEADANAAKAAKERIKAIQTCEAAKTRPALAAHLAFDTDMTAEAAAAILAKAAPEKAANPLAANMPANPKVGADAERTSDLPEGVSHTATAAEIYKSRRAQIQSVK